MSLATTSQTYLEVVLLISWISLNTIMLTVKADHHSSQTPPKGPAGGWQNSEQPHLYPTAQLPVCTFLCVRSVRRANPDNPDEHGCTDRKDSTEDRQCLLSREDREGPFSLRWEKEDFYRSAKAMTHLLEGGPLFPDLLQHLSGLRRPPTMDSVEGGSFLASPTSYLF